MKLLIILSFFISNFSFAKCTKPVQLIEKDSSATCTGFLFSPDKELEVREKVTDYELLLQRQDLIIQQKELYKDLYEKTETQITLEREKTKTWKQAATKATEELMSTQNSRMQRDYLFFGAGILTTLLAGYALGAASK